MEFLRFNEFTIHIIFLILREFALVIIYGIFPQMANSRLKIKIVNFAELSLAEVNMASHGCLQFGPITSARTYLQVLE